MTKLEKLSAEQEALMIHVKDEWLEFVFKSDQSLDKQKAIEDVKWLYSLAKLPAPIVIILDSPRGCQIAANFLRDQVGAQVRAQVWDQKLEYFTTAEENVLTDNGWVAFYDYFTQVGIVKHDAFARYLSHIKNGLFWVFNFQGVKTIGCI